MSVMAAVLVINLSGATMNAMVIAGLMIALGVVIDDAIVYTHSVMRRLRGGPGASISRTLLEALAEVRGPMIFAAVVVALAAIPAFFMSGTPGALINPLAKTYVLAVAASLVVAMTLTPALAMLFLQKTQLVRHETALAAWLRGVGAGLSPAVPRAALALTVITGLAGLVILPRLTIAPAPSFKEPDLLVKWDAAPGTSRPEMNRMLDRATKELRSIPGVRNVGAHVGRAILSDQVVGISSSEMWINLAPDADYEKTVAAVEDLVAGYPGIDGDVMTFLRSCFGEPLSGVDEPVRVRLYGQEQGALNQEAAKLQAALAGIPGIVDLHPEVEGQEPVVEIQVNLEAAKQHGVKPGDVRRAAATLLSGLLVGNLFEEQKIFEVVVWGAPSVRHSVEGINDLLIDTPHGRQVRLGDVATVRMVSSPNVIRRENVARTLDLVAGVKGRTVGAVTADVRDRIRASHFPLEYRAEVVGDYAKQEAAWNRVLIATLGAAIGIVFILQAAFGSWVLAFAIALTLPLAVGGGILAAAFMGTTPSLPAMGGLLTVLGIAVRQSILLVNRYRSMRSAEGMRFGADLVQKGVLDHAGTIVTTALVTAAAMAPFAVFGHRVGNEVLGPLATVVLGGLVTATLYALCVVPALYSRFGEGAMPDAVADEDLGVAV
jgi:Cu/Ag efflux pump CusA